PTARSRARCSSVWSHWTTCSARIDRSGGASGTPREHTRTNAGEEATRHSCRAARAAAHCGQHPPEPGSRIMRSHMTLTAALLAVLATGACRSLSTRAPIAPLSFADTDSVATSVVAPGVTHVQVIDGRGPWSIHVL